MVREGVEKRKKKVKTSFNKYSNKKNSEEKTKRH